MDKKYDLQKMDDLLLFRFCQKAEVKEILTSLDDALEIGAARCRLWNFSYGTNLSTGDIQQIAAYAKSLKLSPGKVAIVAPDDLTFGFFRMYEVYRQEDQIKLNVFRSEQEAIDWLRGEAPD